MTTDSTSRAPEPGQPSSHRIVVGVDGSDSSRRALDWAADQAQLTGSQLYVITAWHWPAMFGAVPVMDVDFEGDARKVVTGMVDALQKDHPDLPVEMQVVAGAGAQALVEASEGADLLVVGSRGHGAFAGAMIGSVSLHCVHQAHCPVLVHRGD